MTWKDLTLSPFFIFGWWPLYGSPKTEIFSTKLKCFHGNFLFADGGVYIGQAGLAYMLWYVSSRFPEMKLKEIAR